MSQTRDRDSDFKENTTRKNTVIDIHSLYINKLKNVCSLVSRRMYKYTVMNTYK